MNCLLCHADFIPHKVNQKFCTTKCQAISNKDKGKTTGRDIENEKKRRDLLTDSMVKKAIYIRSKGMIKYDMMTPDMIHAQRETILESRKHRADLKLNPPKPKEKRTVSCVTCGKEFKTSTANGKYCSIKCSMPAQLARLRSKWWEGRELPKPFECKECGRIVPNEYNPGNNRGRMSSVFCSGVCARKHNSRNRRHMERARLQHCKAEKVNPIKVFMRDGWRCQLCNKKLKPLNRGTIKDDAPELDHIIPLSKGGEHSYRNTQCACRKCNSKKGSNERGQLRLFG